MLKLIWEVLNYKEKELNNYYKSLGFECVAHIKMKSWSENLWQIKL